MKKNNKILFYSLIIIGGFLMLTNSCKKGDTSSPVPVLTTAIVINIKVTTANCGGIVISDGGSTVIARGVCWSTGQTPTVTDNKTNDGTGAGSFTSTITGLSHNTTYYVRAYATNNAGTGYGSAVSLTTQQGVIDFDNNAYSTITIGTQVWLGENLRVTHLNDGTAIPLITDGTAWSNLNSPGYCWYSNNSTLYKNTYGALYNWYAVITGKLCLTGWHVPTDGEWSTLINYLGADYAGGKLKEEGLTHWNSPNSDATNETGFTALPGGTRYSSGTFDNIGSYGFWWSSTEDNSVMAFYRNISYKTSGVGWIADYKTDGLSVRCVKN